MFIEFRNRLKNRQYRRKVKNRKSEASALEKYSLIFVVFLWCDK